MTLQSTSNPPPNPHHILPTTQQPPSTKPVPKPYLQRFPFLRETASWIRWRSSPHRSNATHKLTQLHQKHTGQTAVIIGNGPSLNNTDLDLLQGTTAFVLNRGYLLLDRLPLSDYYFVCVNELLLQQWAPEISKLNCTKFLSWPAIRHNAHAGSILLRARPGNNVRFSTDPRQGIWIGGTVTYAALQMAYFLGFQRVVLIGVDHHFPESGEPNEVAMANSSDANHFSSDYFPNGTAWQYPDLQTSERAYKEALHQYQLDGREIIDATVGGRLDVFPKNSLANALQSNTKE